jgi:tetratricopeptide (TPR) repeat protein
MNTSKPNEEIINKLVSLFTEGKYDEAEFVAREVTVDYPSYGFGWKVLGAVLKQLQKSEEAISSMLRAVELLPNDAETHSNLATTYKQLGMLIEAEASYRCAIKIKPDFVQAHINLGNTLNQMKSFELAAISYKTALTLWPNFAESHNNLGAVLVQLNKPNEALASYQKAISIKPDYAEAHSNLGAALKQIGRLAEAVESYEIALKIQPNFAEAHNNIGDIYSELSLNDKAEESYRLAIKIKPELSEAHYNLGNVFKETGRNTEAVKSYKQALEINPNLVAALSNLGIVLSDLREFDSAIKCYQRALEISPDLVYTHSNLANALRGVGRLNEAMLSSYRALKYSPNLAQIHCNLGHILCDMDNLDQAAIEYKLSSSLSPSETLFDATVYLAVLLYLKGDFDQCQNQLKQSKSVRLITDAKHENIRSYWLYLEKLILWHLKNDEIPRSAVIDKIHVIGESHSLAAHKTFVKYKQRQMQCNAEWISGCKQYHLGNDAMNRYKYKFGAIVSRLPLKSTILILIGEIDCRPEGIIKACTKNQDKAINEVAYSTISSFLVYVNEIGARFKHQIIIGGVPAININLDGLMKSTADNALYLIEYFNSTLKQQALALGMDFLDIYEMTNRGDGISNKTWHLDEHHLLPRAVEVAFDGFLFSPANN